MSGRAGLRGVEGGLGSARGRRNGRWDVHDGSVAEASERGRKAYGQEAGSNENDIGRALWEAGHDAVGSGFYSNVDMVLCFPRGADFEADLVAAACVPYPYPVHPYYALDL